MQIAPTGEVLGATVTGIDLTAAPDVGTTRTLLRALGEHGVLCFPGQLLNPAQLKAFSAGFGGLEVNVANVGQLPDDPEVMILSNIVEAGRPVGLADAGQGWHTDMSYSATVALATVLHARRVPRSDDGAALGTTQFANMHAAYDDLPDDLKARLAGSTATHDFEKFWEMMRSRSGSRRAPLNGEQRRRKPPVSHPLFAVHPVTGRSVLYANPGYVTHIDGLPAGESDDILGFLFDHQVRPEYIRAHRWNEGDLLIWDDIGTIHNAVADYGAGQARLMHRCQIMADRVTFT